MSERTVVVCPDCQNTRIVKGRPNRTQCGRCRSRHTFKSLKKFYRTDDRDAARRAVAEVQAKVNDRVDEFRQASEAGAIDAENENVIADDEYLEEMGVRTDEIEEAEDRIEQSPSPSKNQKEIVLGAIREHEEADRNDIKKYAESHEMDGEKALEKLDKFREAGDVIGGYDGPFRTI